MSYYRYSKYIKFGRVILFIAKWPKTSDVLTGPLLFLHTSAIILPTVVIYCLLGVGQLRNICLVQRGMRIRPLIGWDELWLALCSTILVRRRITKGQTNASYTIFFLLSRVGYIYNSAAFVARGKPFVVMFVSCCCSTCGLKLS